MMSNPVLSGIGYSLSGAGLIVCLGYYFERLRDRVITLLFSMVGLGLLTSSPLGLWMLDTYTVNGAFISTGWLNAQLCVIGMICRPSSLEKEILRKRNDSKTTLCQDVLKSVNFSLLKDIPLMLFLISTASWNFAFSIGILHLPELYDSERIE